MLHGHSWMKTKHYSILSLFYYFSDQIITFRGSLSHNIFREACISSFPTNACSTKNNIPFPLFYLHGKWQINSLEIKCWQAKQDS